MKIPVQVPPNAFYYHYKHDSKKSVGDYAYRLIGVGCHTEDNCRPADAHMAIYRPLYPDAQVYKDGRLFYIRPLEMFTENVTKDGQTFPRFIRITDLSIIAQLKIIEDQMYGEPK